MRTLLITSACGMVALGAAAAAIGIVFAINQARVADMAERQEKQFETGRETAQNDRIGGTTPGETLALFAAAISIGDGEQAALLSVPAIRDRVRGFVQGISVEDRKAVAMKLKGIADNAPSQVEGMTFQVAAPVNVELIRYPSGAWKVVSF